MKTSSATPGARASSTAAASGPCIQLFAEPYVMTEGGPLQSTTSVLYLMYDEGFKWWNLGSASAVAFLLFVIMFAVTAVMLQLARRGEPSDGKPA